MQQHNINNTHNSNTAMELNQELSSINSICTWGFFTSSLLCSLLLSMLMLNNSQDNEYNVQGGCLYSFSLLENETV
jgi:hypothetical protein